MELVRYIHLNPLRANLVKTLSGLEVYRWSGHSSILGKKVRKIVDGRDYEVDISSQSQRLASATPAQRQNFVVSPSGYGIHWPDLDEDLSVDGLIGVKHSPPFKKSGTVDAERSFVQASNR